MIMFINVIVLCALILHFYTQWMFVKHIDPLEIFVHCVLNMANGHNEHTGYSGQYQQKLC